MADQAHVRPALRSWPIILLCLITAAIAGGAATSVIFTGLMWVLDTPGMSIGERGLVVLVIGFAIATPLCLLGLLVPGLPVWLVLRGLSKDSLAVCVISGGLASLLFGVAWLLINGAAGLADLGASGLVLSPVFAVPGLLCGWIMRRFAYRPAVGVSA